MRILLDENIPRRFMSALAQHEVFTVADMGWKNSKNGKLLAISEGIFDAIIPADKSIQYQNNFTDKRIILITLIVRRIKLEYLLRLVPKLLNALESALPGQVINISE